MKCQLVVGLLYVLLLVESTSAQDIRCSTILQYYVNTTGAGLKRVTYASVTAPRLQDCAEKCFSYTFCYSAIYYPADSLCKFSYLSAYNCSVKTLVTSFEASLETPVALECLKCRRNQVSIVAADPPLIIGGLESSSTIVSTISSTTDTVTDIPISVSTTKSTSPTTKTTAASTTETTSTLATTVTNISTTENTTAPLTTTTSTTTTIPSTTTTSTTTTTTTAIPSTTATTTTIIPSTTTTIIPSTTTTTTESSSSISPTVEDTSASITSIVTTTTELPTTTTNATTTIFTPTSIESSSISSTIASNFNTTSAPLLNLTTESVSNIGAKCFLCSAYGELSTKCKPKRTCEGTYCRVQMTQDLPADRQVMLQACETSEPPANDGCTRTRNANETIITCVCLGSFCNTEQLALTHANYEKEDTSSLLKTTKDTGVTPALTKDLSVFADPHTNSQYKLPEGGCDGALTFEVVSFDVGSKSMSAVEMHIPVDSAEECAQQCYVRNCKAAGYVPTVVAQTDQCLLTFKDDDTCDREDLIRVRKPVKTGAVELRCLLCEIPSKKSETASNTIREEDGHGVLETAQKCRGEIRFEYEKLGPQKKAHFLVHSHSSVTSAQECARLCYERNCDSAGFVAESMQCLLSVRVRAHDQGSCTGESMQSDVPLQVGPVQLTCVTCFEKDIDGGAASSPKKKDKSPAKEILPPIIVGQVGTRKVCEHSIVFQEIRADVGDKVLNSISSHEQAESAAGCAKLCYERGCHDAGFVPQSNACLFLQVDQDSTDKCNYLSGWKALADPVVPIRLRCVRCGIADVDDVIEGADDVEGPEDVHESNDQPTSVVYSPISLNDHPADDVIIIAENNGKSCVVTFQVGLKRDTSDYRFTNSTMVEGPMQCARLCYRDGCTLAEYLPAADGTKLCYLYFGGREECARGLDTQYLYKDASKQLTLQCFRCTAHQNLPLTLPITPPTTPSPPIVPTDGCVVTFYVVDADVPLDRAIQYADRVFAASTAHCAALCFKKQCQRASYDPRSQACLMSFSEEQCNLQVSTSTARVPVYVGKDRVRIECFRCDHDHRLKNVPGVQIQYNNTKPAVSPLLQGKKSIEDPSIGLRIDSNQWQHQTLSRVSGSKRQSCTGLLSYELEANMGSHAEGVVFESKVASASAHKCALLCFETRCNMAEFIPQSNQCRLSYGKPVCDRTAKRYTGYSGTKPVRITCVLCGSGRARGDPSANSITSDPTVHNSLNEVSISQSIDTKSVNVVKVETKNVNMIGADLILQGVAPGQLCGGRLLFQIMDVSSLGRLNISNDVSATSPADCASKCWKQKCTMAGYIPNPTRSGGVCLLTREAGFCMPNRPLTAQHAATTPFVIGCLRCSACDYTIREAIPAVDLPVFDVQENAASIGECAAKCHTHNCRAASFSSRTSAGNCLLSVNSRNEDCSRNGLQERPVDTGSQLPVVLDCVRCLQAS